MILVASRTGFGSAQTGRVGKGGATILLVSDPRFRRFYKMILKLSVNDFEIFLMTCIAFAYKGCRDSVADLAGFNR